MPARLPDEELAPVEGAPPSQQVVQPSALGLNIAAEPLASAATVGYRSELFSERAKAIEDAKANAPAISDLTGKLAVDLANRSQNYDSPTFIQDSKASAQQLISQNKIENGYLSWDSGRQRLYDQTVQAKLDEHSQLAYGVQTHYTEAALAKGRDDQNQAQAQSQLWPVLGVMGGVEQYQSTQNAGDPNARRQYLDTSTTLLDDNWNNQVLPQLTAANTPADQIAAFKGQYYAKGYSAISEGASRIGVAQVAYQGEHTAKAALGNVASLEQEVAANPAAINEIAQPGGRFEQALQPLGAGDLRDKAEEVGKKGLALAHYKGLIDNGDVTHAQDEFNSGKWSDWLGDEGVRDVQGMLANKGPAAVDKATQIATVRLQMQANMGAIAATGVGFLDPAEIAKLGDPTLTGEFNAATQYAHDVFMKNGGVPISKQSTPQLQNIPPPGDPNDPHHMAEVEAYNARTAELNRRRDNPVGVIKDEGGKTGAGAPAKGVGAVSANAGDISQQATASYNAWMSSGDAEKAGEYAGFVLGHQSSWDPKTWQSTAQLFSQSDVANLLQPILHGTEEQRLQGLQFLTQRLAGLHEFRMPDGTMVSPGKIAIHDLQKGGLTPGEAAAMTYLKPNSGSFGYFSAGISREELKQDIDPATSKAMWSNIDAQLADWKKTANTDSDIELYQGTRQMVFAGARYLMQYDPTTRNNVQASVAKMVQGIIDGQTFKGSYRLPTYEATRQYTSHSYATPGGTPAPVTSSGDHWASTGLGLAENWILGKDSTGQAGGHLLLPPHSDFPAAQTLDEWAKLIRQGGKFSNVDDNHVMLMMPRFDGHYEQVLDKNHQPFVISTEQAINDGLANKSSFDRPTSPNVTISTPGKNPVHYAQPPVAAAAVAHAMVHGPVGPAGGLKVQVGPPPNPTQPAFNRPSAAEAVPSASGNQVGTAGNQVGTAGNQGAPAVGDYAVNADANQPAPAAPGQAPADNATQRLLRNLGVSERTIGLFGGSEYGEPGGGPTPGAPPAPAFPDGLPRLNVKPSEYVKILQPVVQANESSGPGQISSKGAVGRMQLEDGVIHDYAPKLGIPPEHANKEYLLTHDTENIAIGTAYLNDLTNHFMQGRNAMAGIPMAIAAYNGGPGYVEGYTDKQGRYHAGLIQKIGDPRSGAVSPEQWIAKIPDRTVRGYVQRIYDTTSQRLMGVVGGGPAQAGG